MLHSTSLPRLRAMPSSMRSIVGATALLLASSGALHAADGNVPGELVDDTKFRVCADPDNLPYSNEAGEGFENKIAELLAAKLDREVTYTWYPSTVGFVRNTLAARVCDVVIGTTIVNELMQNTNPYYRSTYALIQRADAEAQIADLDDPALKEMRIGGVANTPPITLLAQRGLVGKSRSLSSHGGHAPRQTGTGHGAGTSRAARSMSPWSGGPIGGYFAKQAGGALNVIPDRRGRGFAVAHGLSHFHGPPARRAGLEAAAGRSPA